jgi:hypothetical protein
MGNNHAPAYRTTLTLCNINSIFEYNYNTTTQIIENDYFEIIGQICTEKSRISSSYLYSHDDDTGSMNDITNIKTRTNIDNSAIKIENILLCYYKHDNILPPAIAAK